MLTAGWEEPRSMDVCPDAWLINAHLAFAATSRLPDLCTA